MIGPVSDSVFKIAFAVNQNSRVKEDDAKPEQKKDPQEDAEYRAEVDRLRQRDREVKQHELAHLMTAGKYARGGTNYQFVTGPDGKRYAVSGEVALDTSEVPGDLEATLVKAKTIRRAALAPAKPSAQDLRVAAQAAQMELKAKMEISRLEDREAQKESVGATQQSFQSAVTGVVNNPYFSKPQNKTSGSDALGRPPLDIKA